MGDDPQPTIVVLQMQDDTQVTRPVAVDGAGFGAPTAVVTTSGRRLSASTVHRATRSIPANSERARRSRWKGFTTWCAREDVRRDPTEPGAVPDYMAHLADLAHPHSTMESVLGTLTAKLAVDGHPLDAQDHLTARLILRDRAREQAGDPDVEPGPVQALPMTTAGLRRSLAGLNRATPRGIRDALVLVLDFYMAGRCSEPAKLNLHDVEEVVAKIVDTATGEIVRTDALLVHIRVSKSDVTARGSTTRILAQDDEELCPVAAFRAWRAVLVDHDQPTTGPLIRRIDKSGRIGTAASGRRPRDPRRAGGVSAETIRTIIRNAADRAGLNPHPPDEEVQAHARAHAEETAALAAADTLAERDAILAARRRRERGLKRKYARHTGHSMRHGFVKESLDRGHSADSVADHGRWTPGSRAFRERYVPKPTHRWSANATRGLGTTTRDEPTAL